MKEIQLEECVRSHSAQVDPYPSLRAKYYDLFNRMPDPILLLSPQEHQILDANLSAEKTLQLAREQLLGRTLKQWLQPQDYVRYEQALRIAQRRYYPLQLSMPWRLSSGERQMQITAGSLKLADQGEVLQVVARDFTEKYEAERRAEAYLHDLENMNLKLHVLSTTDDLTQLSNIRYFKSQLDLEHKRAIRYQRPYSIIFIDVDHFKQYNDKNGHVAGDAVLKTTGLLLKKHCRSSDHPCRYGGEEFVILCVDTNPTQAVEFIERFRHAFAKHPFENMQNQPLGFVSISAGVAGYPLHGASPEAVIEAADEALYRSKKLGRNRVTVADK